VAFQLPAGATARDATGLPVGVVGVFRLPKLTRHSSAESAKKTRFGKKIVFIGQRLAYYIKAPPDDYRTISRLPVKASFVSKL
jgi:hypothetical protein